MANFKGIVHLSDEQYITLKTNGTITVNGITLTFDENTLYVTPGGVGGVSQTDFDKLVNNQTIINPNSNESILVGSSNAAALTSTQSVIIGKNAKSISKAVAIGYGAMTTDANGGVAIGDYAETEKGVAVGVEADSIGESVAIGNSAETVASESIAIGGTQSNPALAFGTNGNIQIGGGTNETNNTVQVANDNIYNYQTHTLTVQNAQVGGNPVLTLKSEVLTANNFYTFVKNKADNNRMCYLIVEQNVSTPIEMTFYKLQSSSAISSSTSPTYPFNKATWHYSGGYYVDFTHGDSDSIYKLHMSSSGISVSGTAKVVSSNSLSIGTTFGSIDVTESFTNGNITITAYYWG